MRRPSLPTPGARALAAAGLAAALLLTGCGAGQSAQTRIQDSVIDGVNGAAGTVALRYVYVEVPPAGVEGYEEGDDAPLYATFVNQADQVATLQEVTTDAAEEVVILAGTGGDGTSGGDAAEETEASASASPSESASASPSDSASASPSESESPGDGATEEPEDVDVDASSAATPGVLEDAPVSSPSGLPSSSPTGDEDDATGTVVPTLQVPSRVATQLTYGVDYSFALRGLTRQLRPGDLITMTFRFDSGSDELQVPVQAVKAFPEEQEAPEEPAEEE